MMLDRSLPFIGVLALAAVLWVVPSIGSQGMGTIGEHFVHPDRTLLDGDTAPAGDLRAQLRATDRRVEVALAR